MNRFPHEPEFSVFQVADAAVHHVRRRRAGPGAKIAPVNHQHIDSVQRHLPKRGDAVDARADDEDRDLRVIAYRFERFLPGHGFPFAFLPVVYINYNNE